MNTRHKIGVIALVFLLAASLTLNVLFIKDKKSESRPTIHLKKIITATELADLLSEEFPFACIIILDNWYYLISEEDFNRLMTYDKTDKYEYISDTYDCDDFAFDFWRNITRYYHIAVGVVFVYVYNIAHAINFYVDENLEIHLIEPQLDKEVNYTTVYELII